MEQSNLIPYLSEVSVAQTFPNANVLTNFVQGGVDTRKAVYVFVII